ncbi:MAG: pyridoxamine 5'-phosphate oxidase family protein [Candidatus Thorarchaeota archaeon]|nr:MAG: pyridoxamine 5'-phosphate oxidase family protein [Candidatus Thorarchaeota archaeon]
MFQAKPARTQLRKTRSIPLEALHVLKDGFFAYLATAKMDCNPHLTAMFYIWDEDSRSIYMIASKRSRKLYNIRNNTKVCVTIDERDPFSPGRNCGVMIRGNAHLVEMEIAPQDIMLNFLEKYMDFLGVGYPLGTRIAIRVDPKYLSYWKGTNFYRWKNPDI